LALAALKISMIFGAGLPKSKGASFLFAAYISRAPQLDF